MDFSSTPVPTWAVAARSLARSSVSATLKEQSPSIEQAPVVFAAVVNHVCEVFLSAAAAEFNSYLVKHFQLAERDAEAVKRKVALRTCVADPCPPKLECSVAWTSPLEAEELVETVLNLTAVQNLLVTQKEQKQQQQQQRPQALAVESDVTRLESKRLPILDRGRQQSRSVATCGVDASGDSDQPSTRAELHSQLCSLMQRELEYFRSRVNYVRHHEAEACGKLVNFVNDLNPKYARVYEAAGHLVKSQRGYRAFIASEERLFGRINSFSRASKPVQPTRDVVQLLHLSSAASVILDQIMQRVETTANELASSVSAGQQQQQQQQQQQGWVEDPGIFGTLPHGGIRWRVAPLKCVARVVEKLALDRTQHRALETADPNQLDASRILDMARGMFTCATMAHALALLHALKLVANSGGEGSNGRAFRGWRFEIVRSKNRFARPTIGGWMDCLVNVRLVLDDVDRSLDARRQHSHDDDAADARLHTGAAAAGVICEIQIVHRQLLTIRTEMGAHHSYGTYRSACELLEVVGKDALLGDEMEVKATLINDVLAAIFVDAEGRPARLPANVQQQKAVVNGCTWGLATAPPEFAWPRLLGLELPSTVAALRKELRLLLLSSLSGKTAAATTDPAAHVPREGSLAESILAAGIDGIGSGALSASTLREIAAGLEACKRGINTGSGADNPCVEVWGSAVHATDFISEDARALGIAKPPRAPAVSPHFNGIDSGGVVDRVVTATERLDGNRVVVTSMCTVPNKQEAVHEASVVVGYSDGVVREWAVDNRRCLKAFFVAERAQSVSTRSNTAISSLAVTTSGDLLISCTRSCCVRVWSRATAALVCTLATRGSHKPVVVPMPQPTAWDCAATACVALQGRQIVTFTGDEVARVWSLPEGRLVRSFPVVSGGPKDATTTNNNARTATAAGGSSLGADVAVAVAVSKNDSALLATGGRDAIVRVWDFGTGALQQELRGHLKTVTSVAFSADADVVASGSVDKSARLWSLKGGALLREFTGHDLAVTAVAFSPDESWLFSACQDGTLRMWSTADGSLERVCRGHLGSVNALCVTQLIIDTEKTRRRPEKPEKPTFLKPLVVGRTPRAAALVAFTGSADGCVRRWDLDEGVRVHVFAGLGGSVTSVAAAPSGRRVVSGSADGCARVWSTVRSSTSRTQRGMSMRPDLVLTGHQAQVTAVCVTPDGTCVVTGSRDSTARLWSVQTGAQLNIFEAHTGAVRAVDVSTDGGMLVTGSEDCTARLWTLNDAVEGTGSSSSSSSSGSEPRGMSGSDRALHTFKGHARRVLAVCFTPDSSQLVTASYDCTAILWSLEDFSVLRMFRGHADGITAVDVSSNGRWLVTGSRDRTARLWLLSDGTQVQTFSGHTDGVTSVCVSPDGRQLLTGCRDKVARLWTLGTGALVRSFEGHASCVMGVAITKDGRLVATASQDGTVRTHVLQ